MYSGGHALVNVIYGAGNPVSDVRQVWVFDQPNFYALISTGVSGFAGWRSGICGKIAYIEFVLAGE